MIFDGEQSAFIEPLDDIFGTRNYLSFYKSAIHPPRPEACAIENEEALKLAETMTTGTAQRLHGTQRRVYRLAMATTFEYTSYFGGSVSNALAAIVTTLNRVNGIYERELAISLVLVADNDQIISTSINDPYTNTSLSTMLTQNTNNLNALIGTANYDIGHVLGTAGGGLTSISGVCRSNKARGATGSP